MPVQNGPEAVREMRSLGYEGLIVGLTGTLGEAEVNQFLQSGANTVLVKPLDFAVFWEFGKDLC